MSRRRNLTVITRALVTRIVFEAGTARAVDAIVGGTMRRIGADREIVLSGGAINSPQLLMLSGIGPADHLQSLGIPIVQDIPNVGANLQDHIVSSWCPLPVTAFKYLNPVHAADAGVRYLFKRNGVLARTALPTGGCLRTPVNASIPDVQIQVAIAIVAPYGRKLPDRHGSTVCVIRVDRRVAVDTPQIQGSRGPPLIDPRYFSEATDFDVLH